MTVPKNVMKTKILRAALYERVSTDEQAMHGYSIEAQIDNLTEYCKKNEYKIVDHYTDEGISGAKPPLRRPALKRLLEDVNAGKIDIILFTKLDRWFRSVQEYFKVQETLDKNKVEWKAIHEDYDTTTANGRMAITIFLAIAQNEREKTSERIKVVFDHKRKNGEACFGGSIVTWGYMKEEVDGVVRLVKNPEEQQMVQEYWDLLVKHENANQAARYINQTYGINRTEKSWYDTRHNELYTGRYKGVENFCEPYIDYEWWKAFNESKRNLRKTQKNRVYLFSGLMQCPECGHKLCATYSWQYKTKKEYYFYRCRHVSKGLCPGGHRLHEISIEKYLLNNIRTLVQDEISRTEVEKAAPKSKPKTDIAKLKEKLRRLNVTYMAGNKSDDEYMQEAADIKAAIAKAENDAPPPERDLTSLKQFLKMDFEAAYEKMTKEEKRDFWRGLIKQIHVKKNSVKSVDFF